MPDFRGEAPDWREEARRKLADSKLSAEEREEISRELGDYLEDFCSDAAAHGLDDSSAALRAAAELYEDKKLGAHLYRARKEHPMYLNSRTKNLWLPGLGTFGASAALLVAFQGFALGLYHGFAPTPVVTGSLSIHAKTYPELVRQIMLHNGAALMVYLGWLCTLPLLGALGASWSRRAGGARIAQLAAGLFPLILFAAIFIGQRGVGQAGTSVPFLSMDALPPAHMFFLFLSTAANLLLSWVVIPGAALLSGALPLICAGSGAPGKAARMEARDG